MAFFVSSSVETASYATNKMFNLIHTRHFKQFSVSFVSELLHLLHQIALSGLIINCEVVCIRNAAAHSDSYSTA